MTSRLMLSLKNVTTEPTGLRSLSTMSDFGRGRLPDDGTLRFLPRGCYVSHGIPKTRPTPSEEDMELDAVP